jgi:GH15 family glucan-1,4-alpha-glucosidase
MTIVPTDVGLLTDLARQSARVIARYQHENGAYPASPTFSAYRGYSWLRDGAFIAEGMSRAGEITSASAFHSWVASRLTECRQQVQLLLLRAELGEPIVPAEMLPTRFEIEPSDEPDTWWNFQTDGYGMWLWGVVEHARRHNLNLEEWRSGIEVATDYAVGFWSVACYDWWEENVDQRHVSTLGALYGGLVAAAGLDLLDADRRIAAREAADAIRDLVLGDGVHDGHLTKWLGSDAVDASLASCVVPFGVLEATDPLARQTLDEIQAQLDVEGGVHRYAADVFYGGGQWLLLSGLLGWNRAHAGDTEEAWRYLRWMADHALADGDMPEQVDDHLLHPSHRQEWIDAWGPVATPLLWSHGMYLILAAELGLLD